MPRQSPIYRAQTELIQARYKHHNDEIRKLRLAAREARGELIVAPLPSPARFNAMLKAYAPGCGSPTYVEATNGGQMPCGGLLKSLDGSVAQYFCANCKPVR